MSMRNFAAADIHSLRAPFNAARAKSLNIGRKRGWNRTVLRFRWQRYRQRVPRVAQRHICYASNISSDRGFAPLVVFRGGTFWFLPHRWRDPVNAVTTPRDAANIRGAKYWINPKPALAVMPRKHVQRSLDSGQGHALPALGQATPTSWDAYAGFMEVTHEPAESARKLSMRRAACDAHLNQAAAGSYPGRRCLRTTQRRRNTRSSAASTS